MSPLLWADSVAPYLLVLDPCLQYLKISLVGTVVAYLQSPLESLHADPCLSLPLGAVVAYLPSPLEVPAVKGSEVDNPDAPLTRKPADEEPFSALAFKIMADQFVGSLTFLRIYRCEHSSSGVCFN